MTDPRPPLPKPIIDQFKALTESIVGKPTRAQRAGRFVGFMVRGAIRAAISAMVLAVFASLCYWALVEIWRQIR